MTVYFEDLAESDVLQLGSYNVTESEIVDFAEQYDPQWFHTKPELARESSPLGDLAASGWHTCAMTMRILVDEHFSNAASLGALGVDDLRWPNPTLPGETLSVRVEILETRPSESDDGRGVVRTDLTTTNDSGEVKATMKPIVLYARRE